MIIRGILRDTAPPEFAMQCDCGGVFRYPTGEVLVKCPWCLSRELLRQPERTSPYYGFKAARVELVPIHFEDDEDMTPKNADEYAERFQKSYKIEGFGENVQIHMPCPFCAAPNFIVHGIMETAPALSQGATCCECGRSARAIITEENPDSHQLEIVQTGGPDQDAWMQPPIRRVS